MSICTELLVGAGSIFSIFFSSRATFSTSAGLARAACETKRFRFKNQTQAINFLDILLFQANHEHATPRNIHDDALFQKMLQRFSDGKLD